MHAKEVAALLQRADELMANGDLAAARLLLQRVAETNNARAAFQLASTYDPIVIKKFGSNRVAADPALAQFWYQRARDWARQTRRVLSRRSQAETDSHRSSLRRGKIIHDHIRSLRMPGGNGRGVLTVSSMSMAEQGEVDPGQVSEGLKAIFSYGRASHTTKDNLNANTTTVITGTIGGTYVQIGADLASMLDDGEKLRVLPIVGRGSVQSIADILYLKGVDLGIIRSDTLDYLEKKGYATNLKNQLSYITKLYNEEMHVVAAKAVQKMSDLDGKTVSVDLPNGGTFITAITVFDRLGIKPKFVYIEQRLAYEKLRKGEIDAMVAVQGVP